MPITRSSMSTQLPTPPPPSPQLPPTTPIRVVAYTTPENYAARLRHLLRRKQWVPLWCPTVLVQPTKSSLQSLLQNYPSLDQFSALAFTSRTGISSFSDALSEITIPPLSPFGDTFTVSALGKDSELLNEPFLNKLCRNPDRIRVLVPKTATPSGLVNELGLGLGRRVLCPVPEVVGLEEPPVVPEFLRGLALNRWVPVRVNAYVTRWAGAESAGVLVRWTDGLDAIVFTSTAEVEGMLKGLGEYGMEWGAVKGKFPGLVVAAHGPVTAAGAKRLGVAVDVVSSRFESFGGVVDALESKWKCKDSLDSCRVLDDPDSP